MSKPIRMKPAVCPTEPLVPGTETSIANVDLASAS